MVTAFPRGGHTARFPRPVAILRRVPAFAIPIACVSREGSMLFQQYGLLIALICAVLAILYGVWSIRWILAKPAGNERLAVTVINGLATAVPSMVRGSGPR